MITIKNIFILIVEIITISTSNNENEAFEKAKVLAKLADNLLVTKFY